MTRSSNETQSTERTAPLTIPLTGTPAQAAAAVEDLRRACHEDKFAVFTVDPTDVPGPVVMARTAQLLGLGSAYVPAIYAQDPQRFGYDSDGFNTISPAVTDSEHRYFGTGVAQGFHVDGTLEPIGAVGTTLLWIERAAPAGGHTTVFDATAAFEALVAEDPDAAATLMSEDALTRVATSIPLRPSHTGPAFAELAQGLRTRWSDDGTQIWHLDGDQGAARARALARMRAMSRPGSAWRRELALGSRTGLVLCNSRLAHGRTAFRAEQGQRVLLRGLYTSEVA